MKTALIPLGILLCLTEPLKIRCQVTSTPEEAVVRIINSGLLEGHDQKLIGGIGDAAAVTVTKVVSGRDLSPAQIERVLIILNMAFGGIGSGSDREPKTALFVLRALELSTNDASLKSRIEQTRRYINEQYNKSKQAQL